MAKQKEVRPVIGTWYRASWGYEPRVTPRQIVAKTEKIITYLEEAGWHSPGPLRERREDLQGGYLSTSHHWYSTFQEAKDRIVKYCEQELVNATKRLEAARALEEKQ